MERTKFTPNLVIDASGSVLGRVASFAAKQSLFGKTVAVINCNDALVTGNRSSIVDEFSESRKRGGSSRASPHYPGSPERIMKRLVRGMLPYKQGRGLDAFKRVRCFNAIPNEFASIKAVKIEHKLPMKAIKLSDLSKVI